MYGLLGDAQGTAAELGSDGSDGPLLFTASKRNEYEVPLVNPVMVSGDSVCCAHLYATPLLSEYKYPLIAEPVLIPSSNVISTLLSPGTTEVMVGGLGEDWVTKGTNALDGAEILDSPTPFTANK